MSTSFRHKVFRMAYELAHATGKTFAVRLSRAWAKRVIRPSGTLTLTRAGSEVSGLRISSRPIEFQGIPA